jgi:hypothetical protein
MTRLYVMRRTNPRMSRAGWVSGMWHTVRVEDAQFTLVHTVSTYMGVCSLPGPHTTWTSLAPPLCANIRSPAYTNAPRAVVASRSPGPACTACDGEMVPAEGEPSTRHANQSTKQHVEAKVAKVCEARACDVNGRANGYEDKDQSVHWWRGVLVTNGYYSVVGVWCWRRKRGILLVHG